MTKVHFTEDQKDAIETALLAILPHGSGIDCEWKFVWLASMQLECSNSFHCMNDNGYYDGYADFTIKLNSSRPLHEFGLVFNGREAQNKNRKYMLRDYLEDTIYHAVSGNGQPSLATLVDAVARSKAHDEAMTIALVPAVPVKAPVQAKSAEDIADDHLMALLRYEGFIRTNGEVKQPDSRSRNKREGFYLGKAKQQHERTGKPRYVRSTLRAISLKARHAN